VDTWKEPQAKDDGRNLPSLKRKGGKKIRRPLRLVGRKGAEESEKQKDRKRRDKPHIQKKEIRKRWGDFSKKGLKSQK